MPAEQVQTLSRAVAVLDCFTQQQGELGVREIARMVNLSSSATGRLLSALKELGVLSQNPSTRAYSMGPRVLSWASIYNATMDIHNRAAHVIQALHQSTRETVSLYVLDGDERVCIERLESPEGVRIVSRIGRRLPLYAGSAGKAMLAYLPANELDRIVGATVLAPLTSKTITDPDALHMELKKVREDGCAISFGEWIEDAAGVASPIFNQTGEVVAALSISGPVHRFNKENVKIYCEEVKRVAAQISESIGFRAGHRLSDTLSSGSVKDDHSG